MTGPDRGDRADTGRRPVAIRRGPRSEWARETTVPRDGEGDRAAGPDLRTKGRPPKRPPRFRETGVPGPAAAGEVRPRPIRRVATSAGAGAMAVAVLHRSLSDG